MARDYYQVLGVSRDADSKTLKRAFHKLAKDNHPDRHPGDEKAEARFKEINHAYDILSDAEKRKNYDEFGEQAEQAGFDASRARQYRQWQGGGARAGFGGGMNMEDILGSIFGGGGPGRGRGGGFPGGGFGGGRGAPRGQDVEAQLSVDFTTAAKGGEVALTLDGKRMTVRVPAGAKNGGKLRLKGKGRPSPMGGSAGDLVLILHVGGDPVFERKDLNLLTKVSITLGEALRGGHVEVPTLDGQIRLKIKAGVQPGQQMRVRGKGIHTKKATGDLLVTLDVKLPSVEGHDVDAAIDALEALYDTPVRASQESKEAS